MRIVYHHRTRATDAQRIHILEMVKAFQAVGHEVEIVSLVHPETAQDDASRDSSEPVWKKLVRRIPWGYEIVQCGYNLLGIPMLLRTLLRRRAEFIYERYSLFNFTGVAAAALFRIPIILEVNSPFALEQSRDRDIRSFAFAAWTERLICNRATYVIVVSSPLRQIMIQSGVRPEKLVVMPNGIDPAHFARSAGSAELRRRLGLENCTVIGFVGWFRSWHGLDFLLEAFRDAGLARKATRLLLIGDGPAMPALREFVAGNHLDTSVVFTGPLPHPEIPPYVDLIDIAVQPAANEYCCPMKILEYMAMEKPIVAPRQENIEELLRDGEEALFFTPRDSRSLAAALDRLATDPLLRQQMGRHAYQAIYTRELLWSVNARKVAALAGGDRKRG
jgi:glycosyltransferase involved in cell wall biosynthesis